MIRDNLKREILFFVKSLAEKGNTSAEKVASTDVLEYALADEQAASHGRGAVAGKDGPPTASSRPRTASVDGRTVPVRPASGSRGGSRGSVGSRCSTSDSFEEKAGSLNDSINVYASPPIIHVWHARTHTRAHARTRTRVRTRVRTRTRTRTHVRTRVRTRVRTCVRTRTHARIWFFWPTQMLSVAPAHSSALSLRV